MRALSVEHSTLTARNMLKKLFSFVAIFAVLSLVCFAVFLFYNNHASFSFPTSQHLVESKNGTFWRLKQQVKQLWGKVDVRNVTQEVREKTNPTTKALERCPDTPPNLVGPLLVEFNVERTMETLREMATSSLIQQGGRYKPEECIAQQKVGGSVETIDKIFYLLTKVIFCFYFQICF